MGIHAGIYMAAAILSAPVLTAGGGQNTAAAANVSFEAPQQSGSGEAGTAAASRFVLPEEARVLVIVDEQAVLTVMFTPLSGAARQEPGRNGWRPPGISV